VSEMRPEMVPVGPGGAPLASPPVSPPAPSPPAPCSGPPAPSLSFLLHAAAPPRRRAAPQSAIHRLWMPNIIAREVLPPLGRPPGREPTVRQIAALYAPGPPASTPGPRIP